LIKLIKDGKIDIIFLSFVQKLSIFEKL